MSAPKPGALHAVVTAARERLLAHEAPIQALLIGQYQTSIERLQAQSLLVQGQIDAMDAPPTLNQVLNLERYQTLEQQLRIEIGRITALADGRTQDAQAWAVRQSLADVDAMLSATGAGRIGVSFHRVPLAALQDLIGATQDGSPLTALFDAIGPDALTAAQTELATGLALGNSPTVVARAMAKALNVSTLRAMTISRTELLRSYRSANLQQFAANADVIPEWEFLADMSPRTCAACLAMSGRRFPVTVQFFPSHPNCRCNAIPCVKGLPPITGQSGAEYVASLTADEQDGVFGRAGGDAYREGRVALADFAGERRDAQWGTSVYQRSLADALTGGGTQLGLTDEPTPIDIRSRTASRPKSSAAAS